MSDDKATAKLKADCAYQAQLLVRLRDSFINIADQLEDEGDRVFFGSTNHADDFRDVVAALDDFKWGLVIEKNAELPDLYGDLRALRARLEAPIPMVLHCPRCGLQHVDAPSEGWDNPPHRSHLCHGCGCIWRPAEVPTTGVAEIGTKGSGDTWPSSEWPDEDGTLARRRSWIADEQAALDAYLAAYVLTTEGNDYVPTEFERELIQDALHGWLGEQDDLLAKRLGHRLFMEHVR